MKTWFYYTTQHFLRLLSLFYVAFFTRTSVIKKADLSKLPNGPIIIIANHRSYFDPALISLAFPFFSSIYPLRFMAADEFFKQPLLWALLKSLGAYPAKYGKGMDESLLKPAKLLAQNQTLVFFPEGKRHQEQGIEKPKRGIGELVRKFPEVSIIPVAISGAEAMEKKGWWHRRTEIKVIVGQPFTLAGLIKQGAAQDISASPLAETLMGKVGILLEG